MTQRSALVLVTVVALAGCKSCSKAPPVSVPATGSTGTSIGVFGPASGSSTGTAASSMPPLVVGGGIGEPIALPASAAIDGTPEFSPDGKRLVFASLHRDGRHQIFVSDRDGGSARCISDGKADDIDPTFGPDGRTVFFASNAAVTSPPRRRRARADRTLRPTKAHACCSRASSRRRRRTGSAAWRSRSR